MTQPMQEIRPPGKNARGKKTRNPGWENGNHWVECERCSSVIRAEDALETWDGLTVCPDDWEQRHPQDFVRGREDNQMAQGITNSESEAVFNPNDCATYTAISGNAISGCAVAGWEFDTRPPSLVQIPDGSFGSPL